ncbi:uncharacterized protein RSE6_08848 [Rhynchosporium secalis]|uniref:Uncharacterized protein n=1 Tax=Rhynchosporium secalis TaxID=38038 RepID=A0A1E1MGH9_RHYSE|nr:uncharacterized protein RSE6_08848 [Rhynchosporium secalis]
MVPSVPPAPTAPVLGQGSFGAAPRASAISGGPGSMAAPPARLPSQPAARGGFANSRGGSYPRSARVPAPLPNPGNPALAGITHSVPAANDDDSSDSDDDEEGLSSIRIKIFTPINVRGDGNLIAMDTAITATKIAQGVTDALFSMTYGDAQGIPMIDEDGRPRPIRVVVSAPLTVLGSKNLMGERAVMERIAPVLRDYPASAMTKASLTEIGESASVKKRERSEVEEHEEGESKRTRRD